LRGVGNLDRLLRSGLAAAEETIDQVVREAGEPARQIQHDKDEDQSDNDLPRLGETLGSGIKGGKKSSSTP